MFDNFDIIFGYSRKQAIADGALVDVTTEAKEGGFRIPTAITRAVWERYVKVPEGVMTQDEAGRLWDILWMLHWAITGSVQDGATLKFKMLVRNDNIKPRPVTLKAVCGPDDDGSPCLTIMLPDED